MTHAARSVVARFWPDYSALVGSHVLNVVLGLCAVSVATRSLGAENWGRVALTVAVAQLFFTVGVNWLLPPVARFGREALHRPERAAFLGSWLMAAVPALVVTLVAAVVFAATVGDVPARPGAAAAALIAILIVATAFARLVENLLQASARMRAHAVSLTAGRSVYLAAIAAMAAGGIASSAAVIVCAALALAVQGAIGMPAVESALRTVRGGERALTARIVRYGAPGLIASIAGYVSDWVDVLVIDAYRATTDVGRYHVAYQTMVMTGAPAVALTMLMTPLITSWRLDDDDPRVARYLERVVPQLSVLWCLGLLAMSLVAPLPFRAIFGAEFSASAEQFTVLLGAVAFQLVTASCGPVLAAYDLVGVVPRVLVAMAALNLALDLVLVPGIGARGAALATVASYALAAALYLVSAERRLGTSSRAALVPPAITAIVLLVTAAPALRLGLAIGAAVAIVAWARARGLFRLEDAAILDAIGLPGPLRSGGRTVYRMLAR